VATVPADQLTAYDVLAADRVVFSDATLPGSTSGEAEPAGIEVEVEVEVSSEADTETETGAAS